MSETFQVIIGLILLYFSLCIIGYLVYYTVAIPHRLICKLLRGDKDISWNALCQPLERREEQSSVMASQEEKKLPRLSWSERRAAARARSYVKQGICPVCQGGGQRGNKICPTCKGRGRNYVPYNRRWWNWW